MLSLDSESHEGINMSFQFLTIISNTIPTQTKATDHSLIIVNISNLMYTFEEIPL